MHPRRPVVARSSPAQPPAGAPARGVAATPAALRREQANARARAQIMNAARKLFAKRGFGGSMRDIARAAGYTPGALYVHFADKLQLIHAVMQQDIAAYHEATASSMQIADPVERLRALAQEYVRFALSHPHHYKLLFMTEPPDIVAAQEGTGGCLSADADREGYDACRRTVADCIAQGRFLPQHDDVETVAQMCWGCVHGVASLYITHGRQPWARFSDPLRPALMAIDVHLHGLTGGRAGNVATSKTP